MDYNISLMPWRGPAWNGEQGVSTEEGNRRDFTLIEGGYVSGREIRTFPGWKCILNPADGAVGADGYKTLVSDSRRPVAGATTQTNVLRERVPFDTEAPTVGAPATIGVVDEEYVWAEPKHVHWIGRVRDRHLILGESGIRVEPIMDLTATHSVISKMTSWERDGSGQAVIVLTPDPGVLFAAGPNTPAVGFPFWIGDVISDNPADAADAAALSRRAHMVIGVDAATRKVTLETLVAAASVGVMSVDVGRCRGNNSGDFGTTGRMEYGEIGNNSVLDDDSITAYWIEDAFNLDGDPVQKVYPSYVANRQRDYGDKSFGAGILTRVEGHRPAVFATSYPANNRIYGVPRRRTLSAPYRFVPQVAGDRILFAVPGYGCLFQVPCVIPAASSVSLPRVGAAVGYNTPEARPRSLGVPKAILGAPNQTDGTGLVSVRADLLGFAPGAVSGDFKIACAYRDEATGEVGQLSEPWEFSRAVGAGNSLNISVMVMHPGYALCETMALSIMIYMTKNGENALQHVATVQANDNAALFSGPNVYDVNASASSEYGLDPTTGASASIQMFWIYPLPAALASTPALYNPDVELPEFRSMPRGASWLKVVRGVRISGGHIGDTGSRQELLSGSGSDMYDGSAGEHNNPKEFTIRRTTVQGAWREEWGFVGSRTIPSSYGGCQIWGQSLWPFPFEIATLERLVNAHAIGASLIDAAPAGSGQLRHHIRWRITENPHRWDGQRVESFKNAWLILPRGQIQIGEPGLPSVQLSYGLQIVDANKDEETVAGGEFRGVALIMTQQQTYTLSWNQGPAGSFPILASSQFGCIAPNAVVEHDNATLWISDRGPCEFNGQVGWAGYLLEKWFRGSTARFQRDSRGMMRHSWAHYDESRGLVYIGVLESKSVAITYQGASKTWDTATDKAKSRFPCDTVLCLSTANGAWSEWKPPAGLEILGMTSALCSDGRSRPAFLAADKRAYVLDDHFGEDNQEPAVCPVTLAGQDTTTVHIDGVLGSGLYVGTANTNRGGNGSYLRVGMRVCIYDPTTGQLYHDATLASFASVTIELDTPGSWPAGSRVAIGCRTMRIETAFVDPKGNSNATLDAVGLKFQLASRICNGLPSALALPAWVKATIVRQSHQSGRHGDASRKRESSMHKAAFGDFLGFTEESPIGRTARLNGGRVEGISFQVKLELFGPAQVLLQDMKLEVG